MRRSSRDIVGGLIVILLCIMAYVALRFALSRLTNDVPAEISSEERVAVERFEADRRKDSARQQAHWDSVHGAWAAQRAERETARAQHEAARQQRVKAYADSQRVWAARREQRAAEKAERQAAASARQAHYDSIKALRPKKLPKGATIDANLANEDQLMQIPGIGSTYARMIVEYRDALGGFVSLQQLDEVKGLPYGIVSWFRISPGDNGVTKRINVNRADFKTLVHHPYLSYEQTKAIVNLRQRIGKIRNWDDLRGNGLFDEHDFSRLKPYFTF